MGEHIEINGHSTWVDERGGGAETVLLLHGGRSNSDLLLEAFGDPLAERYLVVAFDREGTATQRTLLPPFHYEDMATETIGVLEHVVGGRAHLVGWSDGGIVALARLDRRRLGQGRRPARARRLPRPPATRRRARRRKLDRLGRSMRHRADTVCDLTERWIDFVSITQGFDTQTPAGRLLCHVLSAIS